MSDPKTPEGNSSRTEGVYEMLWDCAFCDTRALLGKSNRCCPQCGAPQDPSKRYFPAAGQEVAANHDFDGADKACPACATPNGAKANNCRQCGSPLDGSAQVARVADRGGLAQADAAKQAAAAPPPKQGASKLGLVIGAVVLGAIALLVVALTWKKEQALTVTGHAWERTIEVERFQAVSEEAWCDQMPSGAYSVTRRQAQRSTTKVPDGEECATRDVDRGDGTFERKKECRPKYKEEPVMADKCSFTVDRWKTARTDKAAGKSTVTAWPVLQLAPGTGLGAERAGSKHETYTLELKGDDGKAYTCTLPEARWSAVADGAKKPLPVGVLTGAPDCSSL